jgi:hypothetical protein
MPGSGGSVAEKGGKNAAGQVKRVSGLNDRLLLSVREDDPALLIQAKNRMFQGVERSFQTHDIRSKLHKLAMHFKSPPQMRHQGIENNGFVIAECSRRFGRWMLK